MDKRFLIAIGLSIAILIGWQMLFPPPRPARPAVPAAVPAAEEAPAAPSPAPPHEDAPPVPAIASSSAEEVHVETSNYDVRLTNRGGRVVSWKLRGYANAVGGAVEMVPGFAQKADRLPLAIEMEDSALAERANAALHRVERSSAPDGTET